MVEGRPVVRWGAALVLAGAAGASLAAFSGRAEPLAQAAATSRLAGPYLAAQHAQTSGDWPSAADYAAAALAAAPHEERLQRQALVLLLARGDVEASAVLARSLPAEAPETILLPLLESVTALADGRAEAAAAALQTLPDRGFQRAMRSTLLSVLAAGRGDFAAAETFLAALDAPDGDPALAALRRMALSLAQGDAAAAANAAGAFASAGPGQGAQLAAVQRLRTAGLFAEAERLALAGLAAHGEAALFAEEAALARAQVAGLAPAASTARDFAAALVDLARQADRRGSPAMTLVLAHLAQRLAPQDSGAALLSGAVFERFEQFDQAERFYAAVPPGDALFAKATLRRAVAREASGARAEARALLEESAARFPDAIAPLAALGEMRRADGEKRAALAAFEAAAERLRALQIEPSRQLQFALALTRFETGGWDAAAVPLAAVLEAKPDDAQARALAALVTLRAGDADSAAAHAFAALDAAPESPASLRAYAEVMLARGRAQEAVDALEAAAAVAPTLAEVNEALGDAYWHAGRRAEARVQWRRAAQDQRDAERLAKLARKLQFGLDLRADAPGAPNEVRAAGP